MSQSEAYAVSQVFIGTDRLVVIFGRLIELIQPDMAPAAVGVVSRIFRVDFKR